VSEARELVLQMEHAEQRGDRQSARALAHSILASGERPIAADPRAASQSDASQAGAGEPADEVSAQLSARELLARTEPDAFLLVVGILGLGLLVWFVYSYVL
jgi:hypothetical protein